MEVYCGIPAIDLQTSTNDQDLAVELVSAFADVGFAYIKNPGINQDMIDNIFRLSSEFFDLPFETKMKYKYPIKENQPAFGFIRSIDEKFADDAPTDIKEALDLVKGVDPSLWPTEEDLPGFRPAVLDFLTEVHSLAYRLQYLVGLGLPVEEPKEFQKMWETGKDMQFRMVDYPKIQDFEGLLPGQLRCSEHTDYGGLTILYQDDCGGLEVQNRAGEFVEAVPMKGAALVNVGDFLAMCTGGKLKSTPHRVLISEKNFQRRRQSLVLFCDPDGDRVVQPLCGPDHSLTPITYNEYRSKRFRETLMIK